MANQTLEFNGGIFEMYDTLGVKIGGATDVIGSISIDTTTGQGSANFSSETPFFGYLWTAHDIVVQMTSDDTMKVNMLFDWGEERNISITVYMGIEFNADGSARFTTLDTDGDNILGYPMDSGLFSGFSTAFSGIAAPIEFIVNSAPVAINDFITNSEDTAVIIDVLANDIDIDGDTLSVTTASATNGTVTINADETLNYKGNPDFNGLDTITYTVSDGELTDTVSVTVDVAAVNDAPIANDDKVTVDEYAVVIINVLDNDTDTDDDNLSLTSATARDGSVSINADNTLTYTANPKFNGRDAITYTVSDGNGGIDTATVSLLVTTATFEEDDSLEGELDADIGDTENWHEVELIAGKKYVFSLEADNVGIDKLKDAYIELRDEFGEVVAKYDGLDDSVVALIAPDTGKYYLVVQSRDSEEAGNYKIITRDSDDHGASREEATTINFDTNIDSVAITGGIQWSDKELSGVPEDLKDEIPDHDEDWISIVLDKDDEKQFVTFDLESIGTGRKLKDATVEIFDPDNNLVARASGRDLDDGSASITLQVLSTGNYTIRVTDERGSTGDYQLTATKTFAPIDEDFDLDFEEEVEVRGSVVEIENDIVKATGDLIFKIGAPDIKVSREEVGEHGTFSIDKVTKKYEFTPDDILNGLILSGEKTIEVSDVNVLDSYIPRSSYKYTAADKTASEYFEIELDDGSFKMVRVKIKEAKDVDRSTKHDEVVEVGDIGISGDVDIHKIPVIAGNSYFVEVVSVSDGITAPLKEADISFQGVDIIFSKPSNNTVSSMPSAIFEANEDGFVLVNISSRFDIDSGQYAFRVIDLGVDGGDDSVDQISDYISDPNSSMSMGESRYGTLENTDDVDIIAVDLEAGQPTTIEVSSQGSLTTTHVYLLNSSGKVVATAESDYDLVAQINTQVNRTDTYFIQVNNADVEGNKGDYLISVIDPIIDSNSDWTSSSSFALEQGTATDQWYKNADALNIELLNEEFTGSGVTISVVDTGVDYNHTAFSDPSFTNNPGLNAWAKYENDFNLATYDENTGQYDVWNLADIAASQINSIYHGTRVSGIIAGSDTDFLGLSPGVEIQSLYRGATGETIRTANALDPNNYVTDGSVDWTNPALVDISNNSWNYDTPFSDNFLDSEGTTTRVLGDAIEAAVAGGVIFVFSAGNRGAEGDNVNYHNLTNSPLTIAVASVDQDNLSSTWSTPGSAILVAAYGDNIYTTDLSEYHNLAIPGEDPAYVADSGTSFAAPEVSAIIALMLEASPDLGYRDVQAILAHSAIKSNNVNEPGNYWQYNQGDNHNLVGMHFNDDMGFGIVNAHSAVRLAETWENVTNNGNVTSGEIFYGIGESDTDNTISDTASLVKTLAVGGVEVEYVVLKVDLDHSYLSDVTIEITSPNGITSSTLMDAPDTDYSVNNFEFEFSSAQFYGEDGGGAWIVTISDSNNPTMTGELNSLELTVFGSSDDNNDQYIFTDEFVAAGVVTEDNSGEDWINTSTVTSDVVVDLSNSEVNFLDGQGVATVTQYVSQLSSLDNIVTGDGDDLLIGTDVSNILNGGRGTDTVAYADLLDLGVNYSVAFNSDHVLVTNLSTSVADILYSVEVLNFGGVLHPISTTGFITNLDTTIQADLTNYIDNVTLHYYENQLIDNVLTLVDTGVSTQVVDGSIAIGQSIVFDSVKLSISDVYTGGSMGMGIQADDAVEVERHAVEATESDSIIVPTIESAGGYQIAPNTSAWHAADINNDDAINVSDAVLLYRHIVDLDAIDTFDLIDAAGNRVTSLDANSTDSANWTIVANGDITQGGLWDADYTISMDIV